MTTADEMVGRAFTADLDELIAALPDALTTAMKKVIPHQYTPEVAQRMADDIAGHLRATYTEAAA